VEAEAAAVVVVSQPRRLMGTMGPLGFCFCYFFWRCAWELHAPECVNEVETRPVENSFCRSHCLTAR
jgi:hypothetical protein